MFQIVRALFAVLLLGCAAKPAIVERCPGGVAIAASPFCVSRKEAKTIFCDERASSDGGTCVPPSPCGPGEIRDLQKNACVSVLTTADNHEILDVGTWTRLLIGPDGGDASGYFCTAIAREPTAFGVSARSSILLRLTVDLTFANNELANVRTFVRGADAVTSSALASAPAANAVDSALETLVQPLRSSGATSNAASATATVRCIVRENK